MLNQTAFWILKSLLIWYKNTLSIILYCYPERMYEYSQVLASRTMVVIRNSNACLIVLILRPKIRVKSRALSQKIKFPSRKCANQMERNTRCIQCFLHVLRCLMLCHWLLLVRWICIKTVICNITNSVIFRTRSSEGATRKTSEEMVGNAVDRWKYELSIFWNHKNHLAYLDQLIGI